MYFFEMIKAKKIPVLIGYIQLLFSFALVSNSTLINRKLVEPVLGDLEDEQLFLIQMARIFGGT
jgi:hypothetical protein